MILKGIATREDAILAVEHGVEIVYVSNHGGRQLDHGRGTIDILPEIVDAVGGRARIVVDGGFCRGSDVVKAICLGAKAVLVGRAYAYGLGAAGRPGVARAIEILRADIVRTLALLGVGSISALDETFVRQA